MVSSGGDQQSQELPALNDRLPSITEHCLIAGVDLQSKEGTDLTVEEAAAVNHINRLFPEHKECTILHTS